MELAFCDGCVIIGDGRVLEKAIIVIRGNRIVGLRPDSHPLPRSARKVDARGLTILPGLIDGHVHLCLDGSPDPMKVLEEAPERLLAFRMAFFARRTLLAGVTTIRDLGCKNGVDLIIRDAISAGFIPGPRMLASS